MTSTFSTLAQHSYYFTAWVGQESGQSLNRFRTTECLRSWVELLARAIFSPDGSKFTPTVVVRVQFSVSFWTESPRSPPLSIRLFSVSCQVNLCQVTVPESIFCFCNKMLEVWKFIKNRSVLISHWWRLGSSRLRHQYLLSLQCGPSGMLQVHKMLETITWGDRVSVLISISLPLLWSH